MEIQDRELLGQRSRERSSTSCYPNYWPLTKKVRSLCSTCFSRGWGSSGTDPASYLCILLTQSHETCYRLQIYVTSLDLHVASFLGPRSPGQPSGVLPGHVCPPDPFPCTLTGNFLTMAAPQCAGQISCLAKKFIRVFLLPLMEKPQWTFQPTQYVLVPCLF